MGGPRITCEGFAQSSGVGEAVSDKDSIHLLSQQVSHSGEVAETGESLHSLLSQPIQLLSQQVSHCGAVAEKCESLHSLLSQPIQLLSQQVSHCGAVAEKGESFRGCG
jgi:hypothetical protein